MLQMLKANRSDIAYLSVSDDLTITVSVETITPERAEALLKTNHKLNRNLRRNHVNTLVRDLVFGRYVFNGQTIIISERRVLMDGQHRLTAIVESGTPATMLVVRGIPDEAMDSIDLSKPRGAHDLLKVGGFDCTTATAAAVRLIIMYEDGTIRDLVRGGKVPTNREVKQWADNHPEVSDAIVSSHVRVPGSKAAIDACSYIFGKIDRDEATKFFEDFGSGANMAVDDPVLVTRNAIINASVYKRALPSRSIMAMIVKAWNARRAGKTMRSCRFNSPSETFPTAI